MVIIVEGKNLPLTHLSLSCTASEKSLLMVLEGKVFKDLEVLKVRNELMTSNMIRLKKSFNCNLKKLNLKGCAVNMQKRFSEDILRGTYTTEIDMCRAERAVK
jgi:hypothetical protein